MLYWTDKNGRRWPVCDCLKQWLTAYQNEALRRGYIKRSLDLFQTIGNAPASARYHSTGGCVDLAQQSWDMLRLARNMGGAAFPRDARDGMSPHCHIGLKGCPHIYYLAARQIPSLESGRNGLVNNRADRGPRTGIKWPLRTWKQGIAWANAQANPDAPPPVVNRMDPANYGPGKVGDHITWYGQRLVVHGFGEFYDVGPGPTWGAADKANTQAFQRSRGWTGENADGYPGHYTLTLLAAEPTPAPTPTPAPVPAPAPAPTVAQIRVLGENMWADYGARSYRSRLDNLNQTRKEVRASLVLGCETGNYDDGHLLNHAYGWGGTRGTSYILHSSNDVRISTSIHMNPAKYRVLDEGWWHTDRASTHDGATWACLQHRLSGVVFYVAVMHGVPWPIGPNDVRKWNEQRYKEVHAMLDQLDEKRRQTKADRNLAVVPAIIGEDFNGKRTDSKYPGGDGPGRAMAAHEYVDAYTRAQTRLPAGADGRRPLIDRLGVTVEGVTVREHIIVPTRGGTDHDYAVGVALDLTNRKA